MKIPIYILWSCLLWSGTRLLAQFSPYDPLGENFFPVEMVQKSSEAIGLTEEQSAFLRRQTQRVQGRLAELQHKLNQAVKALSVLAKENPADEQAMMAQLDTVLNLERDIKRTQLALLVRIKNKLTPEQQAKLKASRDRTFEWQEKMRKLTEAAQQRRKEGRDLSELAPIRNEIEQLIRKKNFKEADAAFKRAFKLLQGPEKE